ncbi:MAG: hypothetical protein V1909_06375, partial [Candidatus Micrarchaeota archaeon]
MENDSAVYDKMNSVWKSTCKILFGEEVGELSEFREWLLEYAQVPRFEKSNLSGKEVSLTSKDYAQGARFASFDEVDFNKKFMPLSINEVKDIDSVLEAVEERLYYTGNIILGNSSNVALSSNVVDSHVVYCSNAISDCKYIAYSREVRFTESSFGFYSGATSKFTIKMDDVGRMTRCFECHLCELNSDLYYCMDLTHSKDCMFSFGVVAGSNMIGNLKLPKDKYNQLKKKITAEIAQILKKEKRAISLLEIIEKAGKEGGTSANVSPRPVVPFDINPIESAFSKTTSLIFGKPLLGVDNYYKFLQKHIPENEYQKSPLTGNRVVAAGNFRNFIERYKLQGRLLDIFEIRQIGNAPLEEKSVEKISLLSSDLYKLLSPVAYASFDLEFENNLNVKDAPVLLDVVNCYKGSNYIHSKNCTHCYWPRDSDHIFGGAVTWGSSFCIKSYYSKALTRSFEVDNCDSCSDLYYSHNCENVKESMF